MLRTFGPRRLPQARTITLLASLLVALQLVAVSAATGSGGQPGPSATFAASKRSAATANLRAVVLRRLRRSGRLTKPRPRPPAPSRPSSPPAQPPAAPPSPPAAPPAAPAPPAPGDQSKFGVSPDNIEFEEPAVRARLLDSIVAAGGRWVRSDIKWEVIQKRGSTVYDFERYDELVAAARERGLKVLGVLTYAPPWARSSACPGDFFCEPRDVNEYATWAARTVEHFKGRISHWELWNEPNINVFWRPRPNVAKYAALVKAAYPRMKAADPNAFVLAGATSPASNDGTQIDEVTFMQQVYAHGAAGSFDGWSHHPYTHPGPPGNVHPDSAWYQMYGANPNMRGVMTANGDGAKQIWGTEYGPPTAGSPGAVSEAQQAQHISDAYRLWGSYTWTGPLFWYSIRDIAASGASGEAWRYSGLLRWDFSPKPAWNAYRAASAAAG